VRIEETAPGTKSACSAVQTREGYREHVEGEEEVGEVELEGYVVFAVLEGRKNRLS
jgi:hypothetical protein